MSTANINAHTTPDYMPAADTLPAMVMYFFKCNQEEELTIDDIVDKYGPARGGVHTQLKRAIDAGMLARYQDDDGDWLYKAGPKLFKHQPAQHTQQAQASAPKPRRTVGPRAAPIDLNALQIEDDVPLPDIVTRRGIQWGDLLQRLKPGQSWPADVLPGYGDGAVKIEYDAGYGDAAAVPAPVKSWILLRIGDEIENIGTAMAGHVTTAPWVDSLLDPYRVYP